MTASELGDNMHNRLKIYAERRAWDFGTIGLHFRFLSSNDRRVGVPLPLSIKMHDQDSAEWHNVASEPLMTLQPDDAQQLIDELWRAGLRPSEGSGSAGSLAATERHLADMRALVFKIPQIK